MSRSTRTLLVVTVVIAVLVGALGVFYLYLMGGSVTGQSNGPDRRHGIVPVLSIYEYDGTPIQKPVGVAADSSGNIYVTMRDGAPVLVFDQNGKFLRKWGTRGYGPGQLLNPLGIAVDSKAGHVYVTDRGRLRLVCYDLTGNLQWETPLMGAVSVTVAPTGNVFVSTHGPIVELDNQGQVIRQFGSRGQAAGSFDFAHQMVADPDGKMLYVADTNNDRVEAIRPAGNATAAVQWVVGTPPRYQDDPATRFGLPSGITADNRDRLYVLDSFRSSIELFDPAAGRSVYAWKDLSGTDNGLFNLPTNIAYLGGDRFAITDTYNDRVQVLRLLPPGQNNIVTRNPWLLWLLPLLLIPLIALLRRRRTYVTREAMVAAAAAKELRLLAGAYKRLYVLPAVLEDFEHLEEEGVRIAEYLVATSRVASPSDAVDLSGDEASVRTPERFEEQELVRTARPTLLQRALFVNNLIVSADEEQADRLAELNARPVMLEVVKTEFRLG
jgi:DNA-binding beta-propeller fold protein YncE